MRWRKAIAAWLRATLHSLFPPIAPSRLRFAGGWAAVPILLLVNLMYPLSLQQADWVDTSSQFAWLALAAVLLGTVVGNGPLTARRAGLVGALMGAGAVAGFTTFASGSGPFRDRAVHLAKLVNNWLTQVLSGEAANDPTVFILLLGATVWAASYVGAFALARCRRVWDTLIFSGFCVVVNVSLALTNLTFDLIVFTLAALVLMVRLHIVFLGQRWERQNIVPSGEMEWRLLRGGLTWTMVLVLMALFTPRVGAAEVLNNAWSTFEGPYHSVEGEWQRFFAGVSGPSRLRGVSFSDSIRLGQAPNLGDRIVMTVDSPAAHFWRGVTYDFYTGAGWRTTETDKAEKIAPPTLDREKLEAKFDVAEPHANLLFGANEPKQASVPYQFQTGDDRSYSTSLRAVDRHQALGAYSVISYVSVADKTALRKATTAYPPYIKQKYLQLPSTLPQRVRDLAHKIAGDIPTAYEKAEAIEGYLRSNYQYATAVKSAPAGRDPVDYFLFDLKQDFCEYFSSSMVVMLRELGVPARMVEGFTTGTYDPSTGRYIVRELDAHAWVEAYFPQYGWIEFEPTPSQPPFGRADADLTGAGGSGTGGDGGGAGGEGSDRISRLDREFDIGDNGIDSGEGDLGAFSRSIDPRPAIALFGVVLALLAASVIRFEWRFRGQTAIDSAWGKTRLLGAYAGFPPRASDTTYEYADALGRAVPEVRDPVAAIAEARVRDRYSPAGASETHRAEAARAWRRVARSLVTKLPTRLIAGVGRFTR